MTIEELRLCKKACLLAYWYCIEEEHPRVDDAQRFMEMHQTLEDIIRNMR